MNRRSTRGGFCLSILSVLLLGTCPAVLWAADPCGGFTWDVAREQALFAGKAHKSTVGATGNTAPLLETGRLYELALMPQEQVHFPVTPAKKALSDGAYGGIIRFRVANPGPYRFSLDLPFWIDVVADGQLVPSKDFQGRPGCSAPHKIVEFVLPAGKDLFLQFSNGVNQTVRVTITPSAPGKS